MTSMGREKGMEKKTRDEKLRLVGYCGNNCSKCEVYRITAKDDKKALKNLIGETEYLTGKKIKKEDICCYGCRHPKSAHREHLNIVCIIHECASKKDVISCAHCNFFPCTKFESQMAKFSIKPKKAIHKAEKKLLKLGENAERIDKWLKKRKKI